MSSDPELIFNYLRAMDVHAASDLYITVGTPATLRGESGLMTLSEDALTVDDINKILNAILTARQKREFEANMEFNTSLDMGKHGRFRVNIMRQRQSPALVIRRVISDIPSFDALKLPKLFESFSLEKRGLVLVTGMTGSGKSTTLAAMIDHRNSHEDGHIITIEDPIEYFHEHKKSVISQREVGVDTQSYSAAMKNALRQRPDVILVGEIRDRDVMQQALMVSETGHLCLATIHTNNSYQAIERIINLFPEDFSNQARLSLSMNLKAIVSQRLVQGLDGTLLPAVEVMINEGLVRDLILKGEIAKIKDVMEQNTVVGMQTFDQSLIKLFSQRLISEETALQNADKVSDMKVKLQQVKLSKAYTGGQENVLSSMDTSVISLRD